MTELRLTLRRFPVDSFSGASSSPNPPGPMLLLRVFRLDFFGDNEGALIKLVPATSPSAMFSLSSPVPMFAIEVVEWGL